MVGRRLLAKGGNITLCRGLGGQVGRRGRQALGGGPGGKPAAKRRRTYPEARGKAGNEKLNRGKRGGGGNSPGGKKEKQYRGEPGGQKRRQSTSRSTNRRKKKGPSVFGGIKRLIREEYQAQDRTEEVSAKELAANPQGSGERVNSEKKPARHDET